MERLVPILRLVISASAGRFILPRPAAAEVPPLHEFVVVDHPEGAEVVLVAHEALVQAQVGADRVLYSKGKKQTEGRR